jgi:AhpD family alkylhydroperoxidase
MNLTVAFGARRQAAKALDAASALDKKAEELAYVAVLAATRSVSGIPFHVKAARDAGATRQEVLSSVLVGLPAVGSVVVAAVPVALEQRAPDAGTPFQ